MTFVPEIEVVKTFRFEAAHVLPWHPGKCSRMHGHSYRLDVHVAGQLNEHGIVMEFGELADYVRERVIDRCDHQVLNDLIDNPTAERVALQILEWLESPDLRLPRLVLWETDTSRVVVRP
jgi:6-pyruvoyltetrahydropterin/6-carboxytetrahydropterin synthase